MRIEKDGQTFYLSTQLRMTRLRKVTLGEWWGSSTLVSEAIDGPLFRPDHDAAAGDAGEPMMAPSRSYSPPSDPSGRARRTSCRTSPRRPGRRRSRRTRRPLWSVRKSHFGLPVLRSRAHTLCPGCRSPPVHRSPRPTRRKAALRLGPRTPRSHAIASGRRPGLVRHRADIEVVAEHGGSRTALPLRSTLPSSFPVFTSSTCMRLSHPAERSCRP